MVSVISESLDFRINIAPPKDNQRWGEFQVNKVKHKNSLFSFILYKNWLQTSVSNY
jgi:hypothetical protein